MLILPSFNWGIVNISVGVYMWDEFSLMFNGIVISYSSFSWDIFSFDDLFVFNVGIFIWNVPKLKKLIKNKIFLLNSGFPSYWSLLSDHS